MEMFLTVGFKTVHDKPEKGRSFESPGNYLSDSFSNAPDLMHCVHATIRRADPPLRTRTFFRFGSQRRRVRLWAWLILLPVMGPFPQISHFLDMGSSVIHRFYQTD